MCVKIDHLGTKGTYLITTGAAFFRLRTGRFQPEKTKCGGFLGARGGSLENNQTGDHGMNDEVVIESAGNRVEREYEWETVQSVGVLVVEAVAELSETPHMELEQLYTRVDTDALDTLFRPVADGPSRTGGKVEFPFDDYFVSVHADGRIVVEQVREE